MARDTRESRGGFIFIPQNQYSVSWKILVTNDTTGVETELTDYVTSLTINWKLRDLATCNVKLENSDSQWLDFFDGGERVEIWAEYGDVADPEFKIFRGRLDNTYVSLTNAGLTATLECRQVPELTDKKIIQQFVNATASDAIKAVIDVNFPGIVTYNNVSDSTFRVTSTYKHISGIDVLRDIANRASMDLYIDTNNDIHFFVKESVINKVEYVNEKTNLISFPKWGKDNTRLRNRVKLYGKEDNNIIFLKTEENTASQTAWWIKDEVIADNSITNMADLQSKADVELDILDTVSKSGTISTLGMPQIKPGDMFVCQVPSLGLAGNVKAESITWNLSKTGFLSSIQLTERTTDIVDIIKSLINANDLLKPYSNINDMTDAYTTYFDESPSIVTLNGIEIVSDTLRLESGETEGDAALDSIETDGAILQCELRVLTNTPGADLCTYLVSNNGGTTWFTIVPGSLTGDAVHTFSGSGTTLTLKISMKSDATHIPVIDAVCLLYKTA